MTITMTAGIDNETNLAIQSLLEGKRPKMRQLSADAQEALSDIIVGRRPQRTSMEYLTVYFAVLANAPVKESGYVDWFVLESQSDANVYFGGSYWVDSPDPDSSDYWNTPLREF